ncbi:succinoglycan biotynthesis protein ExoI [Asticcacaulis biprosthecium C19]|uniref:Succinoglycan biotynthesis protein ExoI n=2 Tax=Asticcacaulis biprosthecium TaxID=76891 RepID=F4QJA9_9CAUL|nr:succinoglycan biotynthesis protein ExoI [Asticcacaulis biprosthecium C19]
MPGHCASGRICVKGDPYASRDALTAAMGGKTLTITRLGKDRYGRTIADVSAGGTSLSCAQLKAGQAVYVKKWDNKQTVARQCG